MTAPNRIHWPTVHAWALFDFATTAFSMNFVSTYFALWVVKDHGASDLTYGIAKSVSMLLVALLSPKVGAWSDRLGRRKPFLVASSLAFVVAGALIAFTGNLWLGLVLFGVANVGVQLALVFYNAMLPGLAPVGAMGRVSGYGRAVGYVGSLAAVILGMAFATGKVLGHPVAGLPAGGSSAVFVPTALLILLAATPLLLLREPPVAASAGHEGAGSWRKLLGELRTDPALKGAGLFFLGSFFFFDTINTIRDFMAVYLVKVVGLSETGGSLQTFLLIVVLCSLLGAIGWGFAVDRLGAKRALLGVLGALFVGFGGLVFLNDPALVTKLLGPLLGASFGGVLVTTRPLLAQLVPPERQGEFFGVFILCNDFAAVLGPITWGLVVMLLADRGAIAYQAALATQLGFLLLGIFCVAKISLPARRS